MSLEANVHSHMYMNNYLMQCTEFENKVISKLNNFLANSWVYLFINEL